MNNLKEFNYDCKLLKKHLQMKKRHKRLDNLNRLKRQKWNLWLRKQLVLNQYNEQNNVLQRKL